MYFQACGSFKSAKFKQDWVRKAAKCDICGRSANLTNYFSRKFADLRFAEIICGPPTLLVSIKQRNS